MKLYSASRLALVGAASALATGILCIALLGMPNARVSPYQNSSTPILLSEGEGPAYIETAEELSESIPSAKPAEPAQLGQAYSQDELENITVYEKYNEAVVNITTENLSYNWFMEPVPTEGGTGSGSIIDGKGYVLTNYHVIEGAFKVFITLFDGSRYEGSIVGSDPENDLAVVKFDPPAGRALTTIPYGDSSKLKVGQKVLAIGNPFALDRTLTSGIISSLGRLVQADSKTVIQNMIQTDASINPGNSGGPLLNSKGEMIGINTMIYSQSGGSVGIGFAVPVNTAKRIVPQLIQYGQVKRGWIQITPVQLDSNILRVINTPAKAGILVSQVQRGGNADLAGIRGGDDARRYNRTIIYLGGDIIVSVNGKETGRLADLYAALEDTKPGDRVVVEYWRGDKKLKATVILAERPASN